MKNKKFIHEYIYIFDDIRTFTLDKIIEYLEEKNKELNLRGYFDIGFACLNDEDKQSIFIDYWRKETEEEKKMRENRERIESRNEYELYIKLKEKYEGIK